MAKAGSTPRAAQTFPSSPQPAHHHRPGGPPHAEPARLLWPSVALRANAVVNCLRRRRLARCDRGTLRTRFPPAKPKSHPTTGAFCQPPLMPRGTISMVAKRDANETLLAPHDAAMSSARPVPRTLCRHDSCGPPWPVAVSAVNSLGCCQQAPAIARWQNARRAPACRISPDAPQSQVPRNETIMRRRWLPTVPQCQPLGQSPARGTGTTPVALRCRRGKFFLITHLAQPPGTWFKP